jgi:putative radical SAM enzyme (TIGR03279 family)
MLGNKRLKSILPQLRYLIEGGVELHTQVVVCPGVNDGESLDRTVTELAGLSPGVRSLAVVPVGLTRYRDRLPNVRTCTGEEAEGLLKQVESYQQCFLRSLGSRFVWPADELYILAGRPVPGVSTYEDMPQFENGVGMLREFLTGFNRRKAALKEIRSSNRALFLTGLSACHSWETELTPFLTRELGLQVTVKAVANRFWGSAVTVSGLLTGQDLLRAVREQTGDLDTVVLPPNCLNRDDLFLDNLPLARFRDTLGVNVVVGSYDLAATIREVFS